MEDCSQRLDTEGDEAVVTTAQYPISRLRKQVRVDCPLPQVGSMNLASEQMKANGACGSQRGQDRKYSLQAEAGPGRRGIGEFSHTENLARPHAPQPQFEETSFCQPMVYQPNFDTST
ncbi:hypothetical protein D3C86_1405350 [compost metagenome]